MSCQWQAPRSLRLKYSGKKWEKREFIVYFLVAVAVVLSMACSQKFEGLYILEKMGINASL